MNNKPEIFIDEWDLSESQMMIWLGQQMNLNNPLYNAVYLFHISGDIHPTYFTKAFQELISRLPILRTVFIEKDGAPRQCILPSSDYKMQFLDISDKENTELYLTSWVAKRKATPFDITEQLYDSVLFKTGENEFVWYLNLHHLITDGYSTSVIYNELFKLYMAVVSDTLDEVELAFSYKSFLDLGKENRESERAKKIKQYWKEKITDRQPISTLYGKKVEPTTTAARRLVLELGNERSTLVRELAKHPEVRSWSEDLSIFNILATIFFIFVYRISGEKNLMVGSPSHNRTSENAKNTAGLFIEFFPLTLNFLEGDTFLSVLQRVKVEMNGYLKNAVTGMTSLEINRGIQVIFNYITAKLPTIQGLRTTSEWVHPGHHDPAHYIRCNVIDMDTTGGFKFLFDLNYGVFSDKTMEEIPIHFQKLMDEFLNDIHQSIEKPSLVSAQSVLENRVELNEKWHGYIPVLEKIKEVALQNKQEIALCHNGKNYSYKDLEVLSDALAVKLKSHGISKGDKVGVHLYRTPEYIFSLLAVLKLGAVFVPIASDQPHERILYMLEDSGCKLLLTESELLSKLNGIAIPVFDVKLEPWKELYREGLFTKVENVAQDSAYILYTSGSTGSPKGVEISHGNLSNFLFWAKDYWEGDISFALCTSISFDITLTSIFVPLLKGGEVVIYTENKKGPDASVLQVLKDNLVNTVMVTPSHLTLFQGRCPSNSLIENIIVAGEDFKTGLALRIQEEYGKDISIYNFYGPTEVTIGSIVSKYDIASHTEVSVPIGMPIANTIALVLDDYLNPVPDGIMGTLYLGGDGVGNGYINRPELTKDRFVDSPFTGIGKLYNTGDLVKINDRGEYEYFGRKDQQVKINGYRIELREVEYILKLNNKITDAIAVVGKLENSNSDAQDGFYSESQLITFYTGDSTVQLDEMEQFLYGKLPVYMFPKRLIQIDEFPLTPNGKTDRNALQKLANSKVFKNEPKTTVEEVTSYVEPRNEIEELLAKIWLNVLWVDKMGVFDNFIELGGHSLAAIRVTTRINEELDMELPISKVFEYPTVAQYARYLEETMIAILDGQ